MAKEDRRHRSHKLNPRRWPVGPEYYNSPSKERIWNKFKHSDGVMLSYAEQMFIQDVPRFLGEGNYANLGHARGGSAILLASGLREYNLSGSVYSVDLCWNNKADAILQRFDLQDFICKCEGSTDEWAEKLSNLNFEFVFIDADHCYEAVIKDFNNWSKMVRVGGLISFHDTNQDFSHKAIEDTILKDSNWEEFTELHIHRIRTFQRIN